MDDNIQSMSDFAFIMRDKGVWGDHTFLAVLGQMLQIEIRVSILWNY